MCHADILAAFSQVSAANVYGCTVLAFFPPKTEQYLIETIETVRPVT